MNKKLVSFVLAVALLLAAAVPALAQGPSWDRSSLQVSGQCREDGAVEYTVTNSGSGNMAGTVPWELHSQTKDGPVLASGEVPALASGQSWSVAFAGVTVKTFFKVYQRPGHPGQGVAWADVEACTTVSPTPTTPPVDPTATSTPPVDPTSTPTTPPVDPTSTPTTPPVDPNCDRENGDGWLYVDFQDFNVGDAVRLMTESGNGRWTYQWYDVRVGDQQPYGLPGQTRIVGATLPDGTTLTMSPANTEVPACLATLVTVYAPVQPRPTENPVNPTGAGGDNGDDGTGGLLLIAICVVLGLGALFSRKLVVAS